MAELRQWTAEEADKIAPVVARFETFVLRAKVVDGELRVYAHRHDGKAELIPNGYMLGLNALQLKGK